MSTRRDHSRSNPASGSTSIHHVDSSGECDFILSATPPLPGLRAPLVTIVEAKEHDIEAAIWQCFAQMVGARIFNERSGRPIEELYGCVTNGDLWQFLRLRGETGEIDRRRRVHQ